MHLEMATGGDFFAEYGSAAETAADTPINMHEVLRTGALPTSLKEDKHEVAGQLLGVERWLPYASEAYNISPNINDYIVVGTVIFLSDIPNANLAAFPFDELSSWNHQAGRITYRTWKGKPCFREHSNQDPTQAHGVIFDSSMKRVPNYVGDLYRVVLLAGWDRNRYPETASIIMAGRSGFSMGAWVTDYSCGVCNASLRNGGCVHVHPQKGVLIPYVGNKLTYRIAHGVTGFELSSVAAPAFRSAMAIPIG